MARIWNDPNCERTANTSEGIDWDVVRQGYRGDLKPRAGFNCSKFHFLRAWLSLGRW